MGVQDRCGDHLHVRLKRNKCIRAEIAAIAAIALDKSVVCQHTSNKFSVSCDFEFTFIY